MKKFELTQERIVVDGATLFRIRALKSFDDVKTGDIGGFVQKEENLSQDGDARVSGEARVYGEAQVYGDAQVYGEAQVSGEARVSGEAQVSGDSDYTTIHGFGSENRTTTFFRLKNGEIGVRCGCFYGTLTEFCQKVKETHDDTKIAKEYLAAADLMELHFKQEEQQ